MLRDERIQTRRASILGGFGVIKLDKDHRSPESITKMQIRRRLFIMSTFQSLKHPQVPLFWIVLLRIMLGVMFLTTWMSNLSKGFYTPEGLLFFFQWSFSEFTKLAHLVCRLHRRRNPADEWHLRTVPIGSRVFVRTLLAGRFSYPIYQRGGCIFYN